LPRVALSFHSSQATESDRQLDYIYQSPNTLIHLNYTYFSRNNCFVVLPQHIQHMGGVPGTLYHCERKRSNFTLIELFITLKSISSFKVFTLFFSGLMTTLKYFVTSDNNNNAGGGFFAVSCKVHNLKFCANTYKKA
jgi:hypothetical protein